MTSELDLPLTGRSVNIVRQNHRALSEVLQSKFGCTAIIDGVDFDDFSSARQKTAVNEVQPRFAVKLHSGVQVSVWKADLTCFKAEAVVNAANTKLQHVGGLALALSSTGGPAIQRESDKHIKDKGDLQTGDAIITSAGHLQCMYIIHAVGPELYYAPSNLDVFQAEPLLKKAIRNILDRVTEKYLQSVAIPAISSGIFNYPLPQCADAIVSAVKEYYEYSTSHKHRPQEIFLVNNDELSVQEMTKACRRILAAHMPMSYSQAAGSKGREDATSSTRSVQIGKVYLTLKKGKLEEEHTDVIVNTAAKNRDLTSGQISFTLLNTAGYEMQKEINRAPKRDVIITKGYKLHCNKVFHTCIEKFGGGWSDAPPHEILSKSVGECLQLAVKDKHKSIAFPAIGTGARGLDKREVAKIMVKAVTQFATTTQAPLEVYVVIFPSDYDTFQAFEEQMRGPQKQASPPGFEPGFGNRDQFQGIKALHPQIRLLGSEDRTREAERWLQNLLYQTSSTVVIRNNFILEFGEREDQQLSPLVKQGVSFKEEFENGRASIYVKGDMSEDVAVASLKVEAILCKIQEEFVKDEKREIQLLTNTKSFGKNPLAEYTSKEFKKKDYGFERQNLLVLKVEKVENPALEMIFELKKKQLNCSSSRTMFQCMPAQFLELVSQIGFHAWFAPPKDPAYGEGIYFAGEVSKALEVWEKTNAEYVYFVEAEVLEGRSTSGNPGLILPPALGQDPQNLYDSVSGTSDVSVIFSGYQALPTYIITCRVQPYDVKFPLYK